MANEATIRSSLQIQTGNLKYQSQPSAFQVDVAGAKGPTPGAVAVSIVGTDIDLSQLTTPGLCRIMNLEPAGGNYVEYGIRDAASRKFYPLGELLPGETFVLRLSRNLGEEYYPSTGTGTSGEIDKLHFKANKAAVNVLVEAFEK